MTVLRTAQYNASVIHELWVSTSLLREPLIHEEKFQFLIVSMHFWAQCVQYILFTEQKLL